MAGAPSTYTEAELKVFMATKLGGIADLLLLSYVEVDAQQTLTVLGDPTGGTFTVTYDGETTGNIAHDASASTVDTALEALSNIGAGNIAVTGSAGGPWLCTFSGTLAATTIEAFTTDGDLLTGGSSPSVGVEETTRGSDGTDYDEPVEDALLEYGVALISEITTQDEVRFLLACGRLAIWRHASQLTAIQFHLVDAGSDLNLQHIWDHCQAMTKKSQSEVDKWRGRAEGDEDGVQVGITTVKRSSDEIEAIQDFKDELLGS